MKYFIIGDEDAVLGFGMVGVSGEVARNAYEAERAFTSAVADKNIGIIIITELAAELIRPIVDRYIFSDNFPLIVEIPDRKADFPKPGIREPVNEAIG